MGKWLLVLLIVCGPGVAAFSQAGQSGDYSQDDFDQYWFSDSAEITHYALEQARYGEFPDPGDHFPEGFSL